MSDSSLHSCMRNELWIHTLFSYEISARSVSLNLMQMSSKNFNSFNDFQSDQIQTSSRKLFTAHYACSNSDLNLTLVTGTTNGFIFQIINSLIESWGVRLTCFDCNFCEWGIVVGYQKSKITNLGLVLKYTVVIHSCIMIRLTKLITECICNLKFILLA